MEHPFTQQIISVLEKDFPDLDAKTIIKLSPLLQYINIKTRSANKGSKSRSSFANLYALFVLIEDYITHDFDTSGKYSKYEGANFSPLLERMRELPFGQRLQNHGLNSRANDEFHKYFPEDERRPIIRRVDLQKYWINEQLLIIKINKKKINLSKSIIEIINTYVKTKKHSFDQFIKDCEALKDISKSNDEEVTLFIKSLLAPEKDARIFEIVSYAILKNFYSDKIIFIGLTKDSIKPEQLLLYKTGRTNANDGGIDFVMKPLGRFFQVTETLDVKKYFLDIDKIEHYPITFVVKTTTSIEEIRKSLEENAKEQYTIDSVVSKYMQAIEEIINIPALENILSKVAGKNKIRHVLEEIIQWSKVEFHYIDLNNLSKENVTDEDEDDEDDKGETN